jgi:hypothetical protein
MKSVAVYGRKSADGELFLYRKGVLFATVERFTALIEKSVGSVTPQWFYAARATSFQLGRKFDAARSHATYRHP